MRTGLTSGNTTRQNKRYCFIDYGLYIRTTMVFFTRFLNFIGSGIHLAYFCLMKTPLSSYDSTKQPIVAWRGPFNNAELNALHADCFQHEPSGDDWWLRVNSFSLGWVCMRFSGELIGFVNIAWDGGTHAFLLDTAVKSTFRRRGFAKQMVFEAIAQARKSGCEWLHVDFEPHLRQFYFDACGFRPTDAGLISLV